MKANKSLISALLGVALLAVPITAAARDHDGDRNRGVAPTYHQVTANNRLRMTPAAPLVRVRDRDDWRWHDGDGGRNQSWRDRDDYRPVDRDNCPAASPYNQYQNYHGQGYRPDGDDYNYAPRYYGAPIGGGGLANLIHQRDSAQLLYQQAVRNGNRVRAKHLHNDIVELNKRIANAETRG